MGLLSKRLPLPFGIDMIVCGRKCPPIVCLGTHWACVWRLLLDTRGRADTRHVSPGSSGLKTGFAWRVPASCLPRGSCCWQPSLVTSVGLHLSGVPQRGRCACRKAFGTLLLAAVTLPNGRVSAALQETHGRGFRARARSRSRSRSPSPSPSPSIGTICFVSG